MHVILSLFKRVLLRGRRPASNHGATLSRYQGWVFSPGAVSQENSLADLYWMAKAANKRGCGPLATPLQTPVHKKHSLFPDWEILCLFSVFAFCFVSAPLSWLVLSCLVLSCLALSCLVESAISLLKHYYLVSVLICSIMPSSSPTSLLFPLSHTSLDWYGDRLCGISTNSHIYYMGDSPWFTTHIRTLELPHLISLTGDYYYNYNHNYTTPVK